VIRVALVEDHALVRAGLRSLLERSGVEVASEAADGDEAVSVLRKGGFDVALLDVCLPGLSGVEVLELLGRHGQVPPAILLTSFPDDDLAQKGLRAGARGFLLKDVTPEELCGAIQSVAAGGCVASPAVTAHVRDGAAAAHVHIDAPDAVEQLTAREHEILRLVAAGWSNTEIASALQISRGTARNHVSAVLAKLAVHDRTRAVLRALELGLL
jgi:DNA-binding NarL/FixJ family response regulator